MTRTRTRCGACGYREGPFYSPYGAPFCVDREACRERIIAKGPIDYSYAFGGS